MPESAPRVPFNKPTSFPRFLFPLKNLSGFWLMDWVILRNSITGGYALTRGLRRAEMTDEEKLFQEAFQRGKNDYNRISTREVSNPYPEHSEKWTFWEAGKQQAIKDEAWLKQKADAREQEHEEWLTNQRLKRQVVWDGYFAAALTGILCREAAAEHSEETIAGVAGRFADAMLLERGKRTG